MSIEYTTLDAVSPIDVRGYDTERLRREFLVENILADDKVKFVYTAYERFMVGGAVPVRQELALVAIDPLKSDHFLSRRELGAINIGGAGIVSVGGTQYEVGNREALYVGCGNEDVSFASVDATRPARFYLNSAPAHHPYPTKLVTREEATVLDMGSLETSNDRLIRQLIIRGVVDTCQLQMGLTELKPGSVWNTMPAHQHDRRNEVYFYFDLADGEAISHFMGEPNATRNIWVHNEQAVVSPPWSIHCGAGTSNYSFIWGMAGENLDYNDMDKYRPIDLR